jgi:hypothetical protein
MTQTPFAFFNATVTSGATAVSILSLIQGAGITVSGSCVSLNVASNTDMYWGNSSAVNQTTGALVFSGIAITDSASGKASDTVPISQMYIFNNSGGTSTVTIYVRFIP